MVINLRLTDCNDDGIGSSWNIVKRIFQRLRAQTVGRNVIIHQIVDNNLIVHNMSIHIHRRGCAIEQEFVGDMEGYPIEFNITKSSDMGNIAAIYKNVKYGTSMKLEGESLPADGGNISFFGKDGDTDWAFNLSGDCENVTGTAQSGDAELSITLHRK